MTILTLNNIKHWKSDIANHLGFWSICFLAEFGIIWYYNKFHIYESVGDQLLWILKHSEWVITIPIIISLCIWHLYKKDFTKNIVKIVLLIIITHIFIYSDFNNMIFHNLWDGLGYPSKSIVFNFYNMPPIDPFQIPMLILVSLSKNLCERILGWSIRKANFGEYVIITT